MAEKRTVHSVFRIRDYPRCSDRHCASAADLLGWEDGGRFRALEPAGISLRVWQPAADWVPGEIYVADLKYSAPRRFKNSHSFDYPRYLRRQGIAALASARDLSSAELLVPAPAWQVAAARFRFERLAWLRSVLPPGAGRAILEALLFGEESGIEEPVAEVFRRLGLTHVLVVSGLHFVFLSFCFYWPLSWVLSVSPRLSDGGGAKVLALGLAALPIFFYATMVGFSPSVLRSLAGSALLFLAALTGWRRSFLSALLLALVIFLLARPSLLFSVSFQLSFASVAALGLMAKAWSKEGPAPAGFGRKLGRRLAGALGSAIGVNLALAPWLAGQFHEFSLLAPVANLLFVPFYTAALPLGLAVASLGGLGSGVGASALLALHRGIGWIFFAMEKLAAWPLASLLVAPWSLPEWLAYLFLLLALFRPRPWRSLVFGSAACLLFLGLGEAQRAKAVPRGELGLTMFDVGQGESLLIELPEGQALLLDGGGFPGSDFDVGRNVLMPELLARGRRRLEALALSHPDADHAKGLRYIVDRLPPGEFWIGAGTEGHAGFAALRELARSRGVALRVLSQGQRWKFGGADFEVLWPPLDPAGRSDNNLSLVLRVCHSEACLLLTGDIEAEAEASLNRLARETALLKVAHHGSKTSTTPEFLTAWRPKLALISAGESNRYRLPHRQVLEELERRGIAVFRTDRDGELRVRGLKVSPIPSRWSAILRAASGSGS